MIKLLLLVLCGFVFYSMISGLLRPGKSRRSENRKDEGEIMVEDPQCGTYLPLSEAIKATIHGRQHYFCSKKCMKEYKKTQE
ncbi:MAG: YHS domain-containing protein [Desulfuromusa sp.]|nr:YHS domain-containing protein [Desulfuromusa sp.]